MAEPAVPARKLTVSDFTKSVETKVNERIQGTAPLDNAPLGNQDVDAVWKKIFDVAEQYDNGMCHSYNAHIDIVLVFAGLFMTAFTVESYKWLHDDSGDATVQLLAQIAGTLPPSTSALSDSQAVRINAYWFLALLLSLSSAFVAILARQWILEFERRYRQSNRDGLAVRQAKLVGLESSHLERYASTYPLLLLQLSLVVFVTGILELLWTLSKRVAVPAIIVSTILATTYAVTTVLPCVQLAYVSWTGVPTQKLSPYQSPQAWILVSLFSGLMNRYAQLRWALGQSRAGSLSAFRRHLRSWRAQARPARRDDVQPLWDMSSWIDYDFQWTVLGDSAESPSWSRTDYAFDAIAWLRTRLSGSELAEPVWHCIWAYAAAVDDPHSTIVEKHSIALRLGYLTLPRAEYDRHDPALQPWILLLDLSNTNGAKPALIFELLFLAQRASNQCREEPDPAQEGEPRRHRLRPEWMLQLIRASEARLSPKTVDEETCRLLLASLATPDVWGEDLEFIEATGIALRILGFTEAIPADSRRGLVEDLSHLLRQWLLRPRANPPANVMDMVDSATIMVLQIIRLLGIGMLGELELDSEETRAAAGLASAAAALSRDLFVLLAYLRSEGDIRPGLERLLEIGAAVNTVPEARVAGAVAEHPADAGPAPDTGNAPAAPTEERVHEREGEATAPPSDASGAMPALDGVAAQTAHLEAAPGPASAAQVSESAPSPASASTSIPVDIVVAEGAVMDGSPGRSVHRSLLGNVPERDIERGDGEGEGQRS